MANEQKIKFTAPSRAWITGVTYQLRDLERAIKANDAQEVIDAVHFSNNNMDEGLTNPWACVGTAEITVTLTSREGLVSAAVAMLHKELELERAKWLTKQREILEQINKLQALDYVA